MAEKQFEINLFKIDSRDSPACKGAFSYNYKVIVKKKTTYLLCKFSAHHHCTASNICVWPVGKVWYDFTLCVLHESTS